MKPRFLLHTLKYYGEDPSSTFREINPPRKFPNYMALMSSIVDVEPSSFEKTVDQQGGIPW